MTIQETATQDVTSPIVVHESPIPDQLWALLRQIIPPIVAYAVGAGLLQDNTAALILSLFGILGPIIWGQLKTRLRALQLSVVEKKVSDSILTTTAKAAE